jgi:hypothetical protein
VCNSIRIVPTHFHYCRNVCLVIVINGLNVHSFGRSALRVAASERCAPIAVVRFHAIARRRTHRAQSVYRSLPTLVFLLFIVVVIFVIVIVIVIIKLIIFIFVIAIVIDSHRVV